jgi:hypothetical protein
MQALARASSEYSSRGLSWTKTSGYSLAVRMRGAALAGSAWTAATTRTLARASSDAAASGIAWTRTKGQALVLQSHDAALIGSSWSAAKAGIFTRASLAAASNATSWTRARAGELAQTLQEGSSTASPWVRATAGGVSARLLQLSAEAKEIAERQSEYAAFLAIRLNAQAKGEIDALKRAAREARLTPQWHKVAGVAFFRNGGTNVHETGEGPGMPGDESAPEAELATRQSHDRTSRNALIPVEPWRCRLPVVRSDSFVDQVLMGAVRRAPTEARRSS